MSFVFGQACLGQSRAGNTSASTNSFTMSSSSAIPPVRESSAVSKITSINSLDMSSSSDKSAMRQSSADSTSASTAIIKVARPWSELVQSRETPSPTHKVQRVTESSLVLADDVIDGLARTLMNLGLETGIVTGIGASSDKCGVRGCKFAPTDGYCSIHKALHEAMIPKLRNLMSFAKSFTVVKERNSMPDNEIAAIIGKRPEDLFVSSTHVDTILERLESHLPPDYGAEAIALQYQELAQRDFGLPDDRYLRATDTIRIVEAFERLSPFGARFPMKSMLLKATLNLHSLVPHERFFGHSWCYHSSSGPHIHTGMNPEDIRRIVGRFRSGYVLHTARYRYATVGLEGGAARPSSLGGGRACAAVLTPRTSVASPRQTEIDMLTAMMADFHPHHSGIERERMPVTAWDDLQTGGGEITDTYISDSDNDMDYDEAEVDSIS